MSGGGVVAFGLSGVVSAVWGRGLFRRRVCGDLCCGRFCFNRFGCYGRRNQVDNDLVIEAVNSRFSRSLDGHARLTAALAKLQVIDELVTAARQPDAAVGVKDQLKRAV